MRVLQSQTELSTNFVEQSLEGFLESNRGHLIPTFVSRKGIHTTRPKPSLNKCFPCYTARQ